MVTGLPHDVTAEQLVRDFSAEGEVEHVKASQCGKNKKSFLYIYISLHRRRLDLRVFYSAQVVVRDVNYAAACFCLKFKDPQSAQAAFVDWSGT